MRLLAFLRIALLVLGQEVEFKKRHGLEALETKLEEMQFDYLAPDRRSIV